MLWFLFYMVEVPLSASVSIAFPLVPVLGLAFILGYMLGRFMGGSDASDFGG